MFFQIALIEKFFEQQVGPFVRNFKRSALSRYISSVQTNLNDFLLRVKFLCGRLVINNLISVFTSFDRPLSQNLFKARKISDVARHISG